MTLTRRQHEIYEFIVEYIGLHEYSPTIQEIADHFLLSKATVHEHVVAMADCRAVAYVPNKSRSILPKKKSGVCPLCGSCKKDFQLAVVADSRLPPVFTGQSHELMSLISDANQ